MVPLILGDVGKYERGMEDARAVPGGDSAVAELERVDASIKQRRPPDAELARMTSDPRAPADPKHPSYIVFLRLSGAETSPVLYRRLCFIIAELGDSVVATAIPGGIKGWARIIFKTMFAYGGDFSQCRDVSRITAVVTTLPALLKVAAAVVGDSVIKVIRGKMRFSARCVGRLRGE